MKNFWKDLPKPFFALAPMEDVTDTVFRQIVANCGKPDVFFTEFTNTDGLCSQKGFEKVKKRLLFTTIEHPIVAQIWGNNPEKFLQAAKIIKEMGFDGIDINMGCPERKVIKKGSGSGLIKTPNLAKEIFLATKEGGDGLPVSIKTRLGFNKIITEEWIGFLLELKPDALTVHGRLASEMSKFPANWEEIGKAVKLRNKIKSKTLIIGNGDVTNMLDAKHHTLEYGVDGIMIARGIFHNLWIFDKTIDPKTIPFKQKLQLLLIHIKLFDKTWGKSKNFDILKKFYKIYINDVSDATKIRSDLMSLKTFDETIDYILKLISRLDYL